MSNPLLIPCSEAYGALMTVLRVGSIERLFFETTLAKLRDSIAAQTGADPEAVQTTFEALVAARPRPWDSQ